MEATNLKITSLFLNGSECNNRCFACFYIQNVTRDCQELSRMIEMVSQTKNFDIIAVLPDTEHNKMQLTRGTATLDRLMALNKPWELMVIPKDLYLLEPADQMPCYDLRKFHAIVRNGGSPCDYIRMCNFIQSVETDYVKRKLGTGDCNESLLFGLERRDYPTSWFYPENGMHYAMTGILIETPDKEKFKGFVIDVPSKERLSFHKNFSLPGYICAWMLEKNPTIKIDFHDYDFQPSKLQGDLSTFIDGKPVIVSEDIVKHLSYKEPEIEIPYTNWEKDVKHPVDFEDFAENKRSSYEEDESLYNQGAQEEKRMVKEDIITQFKEKVKEYEQEGRYRKSSMTPLIISPILETGFHAFVINVSYGDVVPFVENNKLPGYICGYLHITPSYVFIDFNSYKHNPPSVITAGNTMYYVYRQICQPVLVSDNIIPYLNPSEPIIRLDEQMWKEDGKSKLTYGEWVDKLQKDLRAHEEYNKTAPDCAKLQTEYIGGLFKEKIKELENQEVHESEKEESAMSDVKPEESTPESIKDRFEYVINLFVEYLKQDVRNSIKCEPIQQCVIRLIDTKHQEFLKDSEKIVADHIQLYKDITTENPDKQMNEIITDLEDSCATEDSGSTLEDFKKWVREVVVELLETERNGDDLKQSYDDDASELDIANVKEDTEMAKETKINTAVLTTFPLINCCGGELCYTKDGNLFWVLEMNSFGNPEDKCWKLILELGLPVFYQNSHEKAGMDTVYTRITNPVDPKWYCSPNTGKLGFYPDGINPVIANFSHIGVLLTNPFDENTECRVAYGAHKRPVCTEDAIRAMIDCICEHYGRVPKDLVNAIVNYYRED